MGQGGLVEMTRNLAPINWAVAVEYSKQIDEPGCAAVALAWCARFAPQPDANGLIDKSFQWAEQGDDAYMRVFATAWPLRALIELGDVARAEREFDRIAPLASRVSPQSSRAEACRTVYQAMAIAPKELALRALRWLLAECQPVDHWRAKRAIQIALIEAVSRNLGEPADLLSLVQDERLRKSLAFRIIDQGERNPPLPFFWPLR